jgi:hypothetical protein
MAKREAQQTSDEYDNFEETLRVLLTVPKKDLNEAREREKTERANAHPSSKRS